MLFTWLAEPKVQCEGRRAGKCGRDLWKFMVVLDSRLVGFIRGKFYAGVTRNLFVQYWYKVRSSKQVRVAEDRGFESLPITKPCRPLTIGSQHFELRKSLMRTHTNARTNTYV
jgi:hypothetical protein